MDLGSPEVDFLLEGLRDQIGTAHHGPADDVAVPTEVLGGRMNDEIDAVLEGIAAPRAGKGAVDDGQDVVPLGHFNHGWNVADLEHGIGQRLDVEQFGVRLNGRLVGGGVTHVCQGHLDAKAGHFVHEQPVGSTVDVGTGHDVIACVQQPKEHGRHRAHAAGEDLGVFTAFHRPEFLRDGVGVDRGKACIQQGVLGAGRPTGVALIGESVRRGLEDGGVHRIANVLCSRVHHVGCKTAGFERSIGAAGR